MSRQLNITEKEVIVEIIKLTTDKISVDRVTDNGSTVTALISFFHPSGQTKELLLWEGSAYTAIGNWTDAQVNKRILELI